MKFAGPIALLLLLAAASAALAAGRDNAGPSASRCGGQLWRMKTLSDLRRNEVKLDPRATAVGAISERPYPRPIPRLRRTPYQHHAWQVVVQVTDYRFEPGGVRLILHDGGSYMNAVIPAPSCLTRKTRARTDLLKTWRFFLSECAEANSGGWQKLGAIIYVRGVGFWSQRGPKRGSARNGAELYPVTGLRVVSGC
jgi:hypothetical protein